MGKIIVSENVSLDGVVQDPTGEEGFKHGGWGIQLEPKERSEWAAVLTSEALAASALLMGRRSVEWFASRWLSRSGEWADRLNSMPKYVVSSTLDKPKWGNSTVLRGDVVSEVSRLRQAVDGEIVVYASTQLVPLLLEHDLVDELRLMVFPVVLGAGDRLFGSPSDKKPLRLVSAQGVGESLALLTYKFDRDA
jgi:dihydrofolate reductase